MIETVPRLKKYLHVTPQDEKMIIEVGKRYPWRTTEYFASLIDPSDLSCPVRLQSIPDPSELENTHCVDDPLNEEVNSPVPGVIRVYPDRIALIVTPRCPVYCRHCLRKRLPRTTDIELTGLRLKEALSYISKEKTIRDVLLTGGDPLMMSDEYLEELFSKLREIPHIEILRIGTRAPCTWTERITPRLIDILSKFKPVWISTQFNHPKEITKESIQALSKFIDNGMPVNNQSVLLKGINDNVEIMLELVRKLVHARVRPYYLYQAQTLSGTAHFVTTIEKGLEIIKGLRGWTTGFAVPQYVLDTPYGKIPLNPVFIKGREGDFVEMTSFEGREWREYNPVEQIHMDKQDKQDRET